MHAGGGFSLASRCYLASNVIEASNWRIPRRSVLRVSHCAGRKDTPAQQRFIFGEMTGLLSAQPQPRSRQEPGPSGGTWLA